MSIVMDQIQRAALTLTCTGPLKERLATAYRDHLASIESADLPRDLAEDLIAVRRALLRERPLCRGEDAVQATVRKMSNEEATELAGRVVMLFGAMCGQSQHSHKGAAPGSAVVHINRA